jgi:hypothetical protein
MYAQTRLCFCYLYNVEKAASIEIKVTGSKGNLELSPDNYDIRELMAMLENAEDLLYSGDKKDRPTISYRVEDGSVRHIFKTSMQFIIGFNAVIGEVRQTKSIDFLDAKTAKAFENIQNIAVKKHYTFSIRTSLAGTNELELDKTTRFYRTEAIWADAEFYFYGKVTNAGGKERANIHLSTEELGTITIETPKPFLKGYEENLLYKTFGIRATGKQHSETGEVDKSSLKFVELIDYQPKYDEHYLNSLIEKAAKSWVNIKDKDLWLREIRGNYDA